MAGGLNYRRQQLAAKIVAEGTWDPTTIDAANANILIFDAEMNPIIEMEERDPMRKTIGAKASIPGARRMQLTCAVELVPAEVASAEPPIGRLIEACGFKKTVRSGTAALGSVVPDPRNKGTANPAHLSVSDFTGSESGLYRFEVTGPGGGSGEVDVQISFYGRTGDPPGNRWNAPVTFVTDQSENVDGNRLVVEAEESFADDAVVGDVFYVTATSADEESVEYRSTSANIPSLNLALLQDGRVKRMHSAQGTFVLNANLGQVPRLEFTFEGILVEDGEIVDEALLSGIPFEDRVGRPFLGVTGSLFGESEPFLCYTELSVDLGNTLAPRPCATSSSGYKAVRVTQRRITGTINPEGALATDFDPFNRLFTGGAANGLVVDTGDVRIEMPRLQITEVGTAERESILVDAISFLAPEPEQAVIADDYSELIITFPGA